MKRINDRLNIMLNDNITALQNEVILDLIQDSDEETEGYIKNILEHGCQGGTVPMLIYYSDTKTFFKTFFEEIFELAEELGFTSYSYNEFAWFGYEETVRKILAELGEEV